MLQRACFSFYKLFTQLSIEKIQLLCRKLQTFILTQQLHGPIGSPQRHEQVQDLAWLLALEPAQEPALGAGSAGLCLLLIQLIVHIETEIDP